MKTQKKALSHYYYWDKALKFKWCRRGDSNSHEDTPTRP